MFQKLSSPQGINNIRNLKASLILKAKVTSFQTFPRSLNEQFKFKGKISMLINLDKFLTKIWKFEGKIDIEVQGRPFLNWSETFS